MSPFVVFSCFPRLDGQPRTSATDKVSAKFAAAMAHASSFNRWAIIEQDLSTSSDS